MLILISHTLTLECWLERWKMEAQFDGMGCIAAWSEDEVASSITESSLCSMARAAAAHDW